MKNRNLTAGAIFGLLSVILGAFGAHLIRDHIELRQYDAYQTAIFYMFIHALALLWISQSSLCAERKNRIGLGWMLGVLLFSGSIILLSTQGLTHFQVAFLGPVTPIGGMLLILAWGYLVFASYSTNK